MSSMSSKKSPRKASKRPSATSTSSGNGSKLPKLKTHKIDGVEITESSGNIWYDLGYLDAEERRAKVDLAVAIRRRIETLGLTQAEAAKRLRIAQPRISEIFNVRVHGYTIDKLSTFLLQLGATMHLTVDFSGGHPGFYVCAA